MAGFRLIQPDAATGEVEHLFARAQEALGLTPNMTKAMANSPPVLRGFLDLFRVLTDAARAPDGLPEAVCERIAVLVAQRNQSDYCLSLHTYTGTKLAGLSEAEMRRARLGKSEDPLAAAALAFAATLLRRRGEVTDAQLAAARAAGLTDRQLAEVIAHVAFNVFGNYLAKAARVPVDWPLVRHTDPVSPTPPSRPSGITQRREEATS